MNRRYNNIIFLAGVVMVILLSSHCRVMADDSNDHQWLNKERKKKWEERRSEIYQNLGLTDEQKQQLDERRKKHQEDMRVLFEDIEAKRKVLREEIQKEDLNLEAIQKVHQELKVLNDRKEDKRLQDILDAREILTPSQFSQMLELKEKKSLKHNKFQESQNGDED